MKKTSNTKIMVSIYYLQDPRNISIKYIGKTKKYLDIRLKQHITQAKSLLNGSKRCKINKKISWIISLLSLRHLPTIHLIEEVDEIKWKEREIYWIKYYRDKGVELLNMTDGGDGGVTNLGMKFGPVPEERKMKIRQTMKENGISVEKKQRCREAAYLTQSKIVVDGKLRKDIVDKISDGTKKWWSENKERMIDIINNSTGKPIECYDMYGKLVKEYRSGGEAHRIDGFCKTMISRVCNGYGKTHRGYIWKFKNTPTN